MQYISACGDNKQFRSSLLFLVLMVCFAGNLYSQGTSVYLKKVYYKGADSMPYRLLLPLHYDSTKKYPMVLFLHGSGERGSDNINQLTWGSQLFLEDSARTRYPAIVVFPQCPEGSTWANVTYTIDEKTHKPEFTFQAGGEPTPAMDMLMDIQRQIMTVYPVNKEQVYVMGLSMGGMGAFEIVRRMPNTFAAAIPICGGANTTTAKSIRKTAFWIFHGAADNVVPVKYSQDMVAALQGFYSTADMQFTVYPGVGHNSWEYAFKEPDLLHWLFAQRKNKP